ncbi:palmitoyltransferase ZDHHC6-like isoform X2 [Pararge aegeria]|uniref:Palmitoyltransferase n=3 Tax=Pararge aegeria TaxID=116150 RepID=A0A8S4S269_9NEOP|nr:palmitoyltransferase ZDHHC6-like isoform X2 [Pararge aegeria]CAH2243678.1 jg26152 [Pararge aegeria aegeria]
MIKVFSRLSDMKLPPIGRLLSWGPLTILSIMSFLTYMVFYFAEMWWVPTESVGGMIHISVYCLMTAGSLYWFFTASFTGPGCVPKGWTPPNDAAFDYLSYCNTCKAYKAPRSLHCKKCGFCVKKLDHHCPWINICVGHDNHLYFAIFLMFTLLGCFQAAIVLTICLYHAINRNWYIHEGQEPVINLSSSSLMLAMFATGLAIGAVVAAVFLLHGQITGFIKNYTEVEGWVLQKAKYRRRAAGLPAFVYPYDLGWRENIKLLLAKDFDGLWWPVRKGCSPKEMMDEQKAQKQDRENRHFVCNVSDEYNGSCVPVTTYTRASLTPPLNLAPRIPLCVGETVRVFIDGPQWLFGVKLTADGKESGRRGYFPRAAVYTDADLDEAQINTTNTHKTKAA